MSGWLLFAAVLFVLSVGAFYRLMTSARKPLKSDWIYEGGGTWRIYGYDDRGNWIDTGPIPWNEGLDQQSPPGGGDSQAP